VKREKRCRSRVFCATKSQRATRQSRRLAATLSHAQATKSRDKIAGVTSVLSSLVTPAGSTRMRENTGAKQSTIADFAPDAVLLYL